MKETKTVAHPNIKQRSIGWISLFLLLLALPMVALAQTETTEPNRATPMTTPATASFTAFLPIIRQSPNSGQAEIITQQGLVATTDGVCAGLYQIPGSDSCTHGPDAPPPGYAVERSVAALVFTANMQAPTITCDGNGVTGNRVQVLYVRASDQPDRFSQYTESIRAWVADADAIYAASAQETGGDRHIRFVHDANCVVDLPHVVIQPSEDDTFNRTIDAVKAKGYNRTDRKYIMFTDAHLLCGIGNMYIDDSTSANNANNRGPMYGRLDAGCWTGQVMAHELMHNLGGVQLTAPHTSAGGHCVDEYDVMCYSDAPNYPQMEILCPDTGAEQRLDCNHDDYFHTNPPANNYLYNHWNTANSSFLINGAAAPTTAPATRTATATRTPTSTRTPTITPTASKTTTPTSSRTSTSTATGSKTATPTATTLDEQTATPTPTGTHSAIPEPSPLASTTATATASSTATTPPQPITPVPTAPITSSTLSTVTIFLDVEPNSIQDFHFQGAFGLFSLDDDGDSNNQRANQVQFRVEPGIYQLKEAVPSSWHFAGVACTSAHSAANLSEQSVTLTVNASESVSCTLINQRGVTIRARQYHDVDGSGNKSATEPWLANWEIVVHPFAGRQVETLLTNTVGKANFNFLSPDNYTLCASQKIGWVNTQPGGTGNTATNPCYTVNLQPGQMVTARFGNRQSSGLLAQAAGNNDLIITDLPDVTSDEAGYTAEILTDEDMLSPDVDVNVFLPLVVQK